MAAPLDGPLPGPNTLVRAADTSPMAPTRPYSFSPVTERTFSLPGDRPVAVWVVLNVEYFRYDPDDTDDPELDTKSFGRREYGPRVGLWRLLDVLDDADVPATYALNAEVCDHQPEVVDAALDRGWPIMGHGRTNSRRLVSMSTAADRRTIRETTERIEAYAGSRPSGWLSPGLMQSADTLGHLDEAGYSYVCDFCADDVPFPFDGYDLLSVPYSLDLNDKGLFGRQGLAGPQYRDAVLDAFETLRADARRTGVARVLPIPLHPHITGQSFRAPYLGEALDRLADADDAWLTTGDELAAHYRSQSR